MLAGGREKVIEQIIQVRVEASGSPVADRRNGSRRDRAPRARAAAARERSALREHGRARRRRHRARRRRRPVHLVQRQAARDARVRRDELLERHDPGHLPPGRRAPHGRATARACTRARSHRSRRRNATCASDGTVIWVRITGAPRRASDGVAALRRLDRRGHHGPQGGRGPASSISPRTTSSRDCRIAPLFGELLRARDRGREAPRPPMRGSVHRSRPLQDRQRLARPRGRRPAAARSGDPSAAVHARESDVRRAARRRRVRRAARASSRIPRPAAEVAKKMLCAACSRRSRSWGTSAA